MTNVHLDHLAEQFIRWRLRTLGLTFEQFAAVPPRQRQQYLKQQRQRLRDWRDNPRYTASLAIILN